MMILAGQVHQWLLSVVVVIWVQRGGDFNNSLLGEIVCDAFLRYLLLTAIQPGIVKGKVHLNVVMLFFSESITLFLHLVKGR